MPCHVDTYPPKSDKNEINMVVEVVNEKIKIKRVGDDFMGKYPTVAELLDKAKKKWPTFHYKVDCTMIVFVSPCPKGC